MLIAATNDPARPGCGSSVWKACPPNPAPHCGRCGWSHSARSSAKVSPPSVERNTAPGSVPAHTRPGSQPAASAQTRSTLPSTSSGIRTDPSGVSSQVAPRSSERRTCGPIQLEEAPTSSRAPPPRVSTRQEYTSSIGWWGPLTSHS